MIKINNTKSGLGIRWHLCTQKTTLYTNETLTARLQRKWQPLVDHAPVSL